MIRTSLLSLRIAVALLWPHCLVTGLCSADYDPVYCTLLGILYPNRCNAVEAGGYDPADCTVPRTFGASCPTTVSSRIVCGTGTVFDNICLASQAGFVPSTQCSIVTRPPTHAPTKAPTAFPTRSPTPPTPPVCLKETTTCTITSGSKPCCTGWVCRRVSASSSTTSRTCQKCLPNTSLCLENRDCCSKKCQLVSGKLKCKA